MLATRELILPKKIWTPLPGIPEIGASAQFFGYTTDAHEILLHGTRGSGKTSVHLMRFAKNLYRGWGSRWRGAMIARRYQGLKDIEAQSLRLFKFLGGRFYSSASDKKWVFPKGEELVFLNIDKESTFEDKLLGQEYAWMGFNELTLFPQDVYNLACTSNRLTFNPQEDTEVRKNVFGEPMYNQDGSLIYDTWDGKLAPPLVTEVCSTTNSYGPHRNWVKREFIDQAPPGVMIISSQDVDGKITQKKKIHIFSSWVENIEQNGGKLKSDYIITLRQSCKGNKNREKSWIEGSWDITSGGAFDDLWDSKVHIVKRFKIPYSWRLYCAMDWGASKPFSIQWWAETDGTEAILQDGRRWCPAPNSLIMYAEWYGGVAGENKGFNLPSYEVARGIVQREQNLHDELWVHPKSPYLDKKRIKGVYRDGITKNKIADNSIGDVSDQSHQSTKTTFFEEGVDFGRSNKDPGTRVIGVQLMRDRLQCTLENDYHYRKSMGLNLDAPQEGRSIYIMDNCKDFIYLFPTLPTCPKNSDDVDTQSEDHIWDTLRYILFEVRAGIEKTTVRTFKGGY